MNKQQKEVIQSQLNNEKSVLRQIKKEYKGALYEINKKIKDFQTDIQAKQDALAIIQDESQKALLQSEIQSKIYQKQYQEALKQQVGTILDNMNSRQYDTIKDYIDGCYESGFVGTMYDIHGQGIPVITPIDQTQVIAATINETKLSKPLYSALGYQVGNLKKAVNSEISRGIASNLSYADIARNIEKRSGVTMNNAIRIARTEGHRVQSKASYDAQLKAKSKGADVLKQWDATLDARTRDSHARLDGEIRELDKKFSNGLMYPGDSHGSAAEVINCRCSLLQRARWALDEDEYEILKMRANYFGLDKTDDFRGFRKTYLKVAERAGEYETQITDVTNRLLEKAKAAEPAITKDLQKIINNTNGKIDYSVGNGATALDFRLKSQSSLKRKITSDFIDGYDLDYIEHHIYDNVRYTDLIDKKFLVSDYVKVQDDLSAKGYKILRVKNTLGNVDSAYRGLNTVVESPDGYKFELQFHTPESIEIKENVHKLYEVYRLDTTSDAEKLRLDDEMKKISSSLPAIKNIDAIKSYNTFKGEKPIKVKL